MACGCKKKNSPRREMRQPTRATRPVPEVATPENSTNYEDLLASVVGDLPGVSSEPSEIHYRANVGDLMLLDIYHNLTGEKPAIIEWDVIEKVTKDLTGAEARDYPDAMRLIKEEIAKRNLNLDQY